jgi:hypothetical protein
MLVALFLALLKGQQEKEARKVPQEKSAVGDSPESFNA